MNSPLFEDSRRFCADCGVWMAWDGDGSAHTYNEDPVPTWTTFDANGNPDLHLSDPGVPAFLLWAGRGQRAVEQYDGLNDAAWCDMKIDSGGRVIRRKA